MTPKLTKLWTDVRCVTGEQTIRADFSNDRHYEVVIIRPGESQQIAHALFDLAYMVAHDPHLVPNARLTGAEPVGGASELKR